MESDKINKTNVTYLYIAKNILKNLINFVKKKIIIDKFLLNLNFKYSQIKKINIENTSVFKIGNCKFFSNCPLIYDNKNKIISQSIDYLSRINSKRIRIKKKIILNEVVINLCDDYHKNYFHFIIDTLFKLYIFKKLNIKEYKIIFLKKNYNTFRKTILKKIFAEEEKKILLVDDNVEVYAPYIYHVNSNFQINYSKFKNYIVFLNKKILKLKTNNNNNNNTKKIYITREKTGYRGFINENKLISLLKKYGFKVYSFDNETVLNQFKIFNKARLIVASHGSALTNLIASNRHVKVIEIHSEIITDHYIKLANLLSIKNYFTFSIQKDNPYFNFISPIQNKNKNKVIDSNFLMDLEYIIKN